MTGNGCKLPILAGILLMSVICLSPASAGDAFEDKNIMAVVTGAPANGAVVDVNIPQAGYHYEASIPVDQPFAAGTILMVLDIEGNYLELKLRDGTVKKLGPGDTYTIPSLEYALDVGKVPGTADEYEVTETYKSSTKTPTPLPGEISGSIEEVGDAMEAFETGEIGSGDLLSIIQDAIDSVMAFIEGLFPANGS